MSRTQHIFAIFVRGDSLISWLIRRGTKSQWSHCAIGFTAYTGEEFYYEALASENVSGPKPLYHLTDWVNEKPLSRSYRRIEIPQLDQVAETKRCVCETFVGLKTPYNEWQLFFIWLFYRFGIPVPKSERSVVCSEFLAKVLLPEIILTDKKHPNVDSIVPGSLHDNLLAWLDAQKAHKSFSQIMEGLK